jgi:SAM-dependent methyltransferase
MSLRYQTSLDLDSPERTLFHRELILQKSFLKKLYLEWYDVFSSEIKNLPDGKLIELGSGGGFLKEICPEVLCSDILPLPGNDMTFSALEMPFKKNEVSGILMLDTFHHIPDAHKFFQEADRILKKEGKIVMIEPANSHWGRFIYKNFHHEPFDPKGTWQIPASGPLSGANGALPWILFVRDRLIFEKKFPELRIESITYHTPFRYLVSGGVSFRSLVPSWSYGFFKGVDKTFTGLSKQISMFMTIKLEKK